MSADFIIENGILKSYCGEGGHVIIPEGVTEIGANAFYNCQSLTSIHIPEGITAIGSSAFKSCTNLTSIRVPDSVTEIGDFAFSLCENLKRIRFPAHFVWLNTFWLMGCGKIERFLAPQISIDTLYGADLKAAAARSFLEEYELYTDPKTFTSNKDYIFSHSFMFLPAIFSEDDDSALAFFAQHGGITAEFYDEMYLTPALEAGAAKCIALLLEWKNIHLPNVNSELTL